MSLGRHADSAYGTLARVSGLALVLVTVAFQRRGLMHWSELVFLGACIGLQEVFLRLNRLRRYRTGMLVAYTMLPLALIGLRAGEISQYRGSFVPLVVETPLALVFVSVQIMVLYLRESARLTSVVLVLALFSTVIGVRRNLDDALWPWMAAICAVTAFFLAVQHPGALFSSLLHSLAGRATTQTQGARPAGVLRPAFAALVPVLVLATVLGAAGLFFVLPRPSLQGPDGQPGGGGPGQTQPGQGRPGQRPPGQGQGGGHSGAENASMSGLADGVSLGDFGRIQLDEKPALTLRRVGEHRPPSAEVHLRTYTFGEFDGERWLPLNELVSPRRAVAEGERRPLPGAPVQAGSAFSGRTYEITIRSGATGTRGELPMATEARTLLSVTGPASYGSQDHSVRAPMVRPDTSYRVECVEMVAQPADLQAALAGRRAGTTGVPAEYLSLPAGLREKLRQVFRYQNERGQVVALFDDLEARAQARNTRDAAPRRGAYAAAARIVELFARMTVGPEKAWKYSLEFRPLPGPDPIVRFLDLSARGERFGHCEYFATAMTLLLRCFGIPARLCAGFLAKKPDASGVYEVTFANAHAWVEAWLPGHGWVMFDPTPGAEPEPGVGPEPETQAQPDPAQAGGESGPEASTGPDPFRDYDARDQQALWDDLSRGLAGATEAAENLLTALTSWLPDWAPSGAWLRALLLLLPPGVALAVVLLWKRRRRRQVEKVLGQAASDGRRRERGLYAQLLLLLARHGFQKLPSETPREFALRVTQKGGDLHQDLPLLTQQYYGFRFGSHEALVDDFKRGLSRYAARLKASASRANPG